jgi:hypothetical protein
MENYNGNGKKKGVIMQPQPRTTGQAIIPGQCEPFIGDAETEDTMPPREDSFERLLETFERRASERDEKFITAMTNNGGNGNGKKPIYLAIVLGALLGYAPSVFSGIWSARGIERDLNSDIRTLTLKLEKTESDLTQWKAEVSTMRTWNEKLRNNMAERGYMIDPITAEIKTRRK